MAEVIDRNATTSGAFELPLSSAQTTTPHDPLADTGIAAEVCQRALAFGALGVMLAGVLAMNGVMAFQGAFVLQVMRVATDVQEGNILLSVARSLLATKIPCQTAYDRAALTQIVESSLAPLPAADPRLNFDLLEACSVRRFPIKDFPGAKGKTAIRFSDAVLYARDYHPGIFDALKGLTCHMSRFYDDQAAAAVLQACVLEPHYTNAAELAVRMLRDKDGCVNLTVAVKAMGWETELAAAVVTECNTLQGRGTGDVDLTASSLERCGSAGVDKAVVAGTDDELRRAINIVLDQELDLDSYKYITPEEMWDTRWSWCVNGSHNRAMERAEPELAVSTRGRIHRRVAIEDWTEDPTKNWDGTVYVSASKKLECGKTRLLLACDSRSYIAFQHLVGPVEAAWRNERSILDPGRFGQSMMAEKVRGMRSRGNLNVMMDYDDFNSQHTLRAMELVIEEVGKRVNYPADRLATLVTSISRMKVHACGKECGYITGTMPSGHRCTTFWNTILNSAYIIMSAPDMWTSFNSCHTGDDIVSVFSSYEHVEVVIDGLRARGLKLNPIKQSVGSQCAEFLRMGITDRLVQGYPARAIASAIAGNWANESVLGEDEAIQSALICATSIRNRTRGSTVGIVLAYALRRKYGIRKTLGRRILSGTVAVGEGPVFGDVAVWSGVDINAAKVGVDDDVVVRTRPHRATRDYLSKGVTPVERLGLQLAETSVEDTMIHASYDKSTKVQSNLAYAPVAVSVKYTSRVTLDSAIAEKQLAKPRLIGKLVRYPLLSLIKNQLTRDHVIQLLDAADVVYVGDPVEAAWGRTQRGNVIRGYLSYADAASLSSRCGNMIIYVMNPVFM